MTTVQLHVGTGLDDDDDNDVHMYCVQNMHLLSHMSSKLNHYLLNHLRR